MADTLPPQEKVNGLTINADLSQGPFYIDGQDTTPKLFRDRARALGTRTAHREKTFGIWRSHSWDAYFTHAKHLGLGLVSLGLQRGEVVSILSEDCKEWMYTDMGVQSVGAICSGVYTTDSATQLEYLVNNSDSRFFDRRERRATGQVPASTRSDARPDQSDRDRARRPARVFRPATSCFWTSFTRWARHMTQPTPSRSTPRLTRHTRRHGHSGLYLRHHRQAQRRDDQPWQPDVFRLCRTARRARVRHR